MTILKNHWIRWQKRAKVSEDLFNSFWVRGGWGLEWEIFHSNRWIIWQKTKRVSKKRFLPSDWGGATLFLPLRRLPLPPKTDVGQSLWRQISHNINIASGATNAPFKKAKERPWKMSLQYPKKNCPSNLDGEGETMLSFFLETPLSFLRSSSG